MNKQFLEFKENTIKQDKPYPLDYIMVMPKHKIKGKDTQHMAEVQRLENIVKNVVIRRLTEIRIIKAKPSLRDMIDAYMKKKGAKDSRALVRMKEQVMHLYEKEYEKQFQEKDPYFNKVIIHLERVHKLTTAQTLGLDCLEKRVTNISKKN